MTKGKGEEIMIDMIVVCMFAIVCTLSIVNQFAEMIDRWRN